MDELLFAVQSSKLRKSKSDGKQSEEASAEDIRQERLMMMAFRMGQTSNNLEASSSRTGAPTQPVIPALGNGSAANAPVQASNRAV